MWSSPRLVSQLISSLYFNLRYNVLQIVWKTRVYHYDPHHGVSVKNFRFHTWLVVIHTQKEWISSSYEKISFIYRGLHISFSIFFTLCDVFFSFSFIIWNFWYWMAYLFSKYELSIELTCEKPKRIVSKRNSLKGLRIFHWHFFPL